MILPSTFVIEYDFLFLRENWYWENDCQNHIVLMIFITKAIIFLATQDFADFYIHTKTSIIYLINIVKNGNFNKYFLYIINK